MKINVPHKTTEADAIARVKKLLQENKSKIEEKASDVKTEWSGNTLHFGFTAEGNRIEGTLVAREHEYEIEARLPLMLRLFEGTIERMIKEEVKKLNI